jgi:hypothetical protein
VRFIATSQSLDTDQSNPTSRLLLQILATRGAASPPNMAFL